MWLRIQPTTHRWGWSKNGKSASEKGRPLSPLLYSELRRSEAGFISSRQEIVCCLWGNDRAKESSPDTGGTATCLCSYKVVLSYYSQFQTHPSGLYSVNQAGTLLTFLCCQGLLGRLTLWGKGETEAGRDKGSCSCLSTFCFWQNHPGRASLPGYAVHSSLQPCVGVLPSPRLGP